jgi:hypothetical protein
LGVIGIDLQSGVVFGNRIWQAAGHLGQRNSQAVVRLRIIGFAP